MQKIREPNSVLTEETYRSQSLVNMSDDMIRVTFSIPLREWWSMKQKFIELLHGIRLKGVQNERSERGLL